MLAKKATFRFAVPAIFLSVALSSAPVFAGPSNVPFKATVATHETLTPNPAVCVNAPYLVGTTTGTGTASHLGAITFLATDCITPGPTTFTFAGGKLAITAANGDELFATYSGTLVPIPNVAPFTLYTISGRFLVTGGTGRFSSATGSGELRGTENIQTGQGQFDLAGTISY